VSTLVGIALDARLIGSVDDRLTEYLPELAADQRGRPQKKLNTLAAAALAAHGHPMPRIKGA
jgi:hypothetical protein